jgi:hypothetical protein
VDTTTLRTAAYQPAESNETTTMTSHGSSSISCGPDVKRSNTNTDTGAVVAASLSSSSPTQNTTTTNSKRRRSPDDDEWTEEEDKMLRDLASNHSHLETKKKWGKVAEEMNKQFNSASSPSPCGNRTELDCASRHWTLTENDLENELENEKTKNKKLEKKLEKNSLESENKNKELENELENKNKELENKNKRLENEKTKNKKLEKKLEKNSLESLFSVSPDQFLLTCVENNSSHTNGDYAAPVEAEIADFPIFKPSDAQLELLKKSDANASLLLAKLAGKVYPYSTEADIADVVRMAVDDAICILEELDKKKYSKQLSSHLERSLFAHRPDILIVRFNKIRICAVEVKKPVHPRSLSSFPPVMGQAFHYLKLLRATGQKNPCVVVTSFTKSFVCWSEEEEEKSQHAATSQDSPSSMMESCQSNPAPQPTFKDETSHQNSPSPSREDSSCATTCSASPPKLVRELSDQSSAHPGFVSNSDQKWTRSPDIDSYQLVQLFCAIIQKIDVQEPPKSIKGLQPTSQYRFANCLHVNDGEKTCTWGTLTMRLGSDIPPLAAAAAGSSSSSPHQHQHYYIIGKLGEGRTSNVYHALDSKGAEVALKVYVKATGSDDQWLDKNMFQKAAREATTRERKHLLTCYPHLTDKVRLVTLFDGLPCIVMPFFEPVAKSERKSTLPLIMETLRMCIFDYSLAYKDEDVRWRHVGMHQDDKGKKHCILYDLAELQDLKDNVDNVDKPSLLDAHYKIFKNRMSYESEVEGEMFIHEKA